jgi:hypothetical protein
LLLLAAYVLLEVNQGDSRLDEKTDVLISIVLIALTIALVIVFLGMAGLNLRKILRRWQRAYRRRRAASAARRKQSAADEADDLQLGVRQSEDGRLVMTNHGQDAGIVDAELSEVRRGSGSVANVYMNTPQGKRARLQMNPLFLRSQLSDEALSRASSDIGSQVEGADPSGGLGPDAQGTGDDEQDLYPEELAVLQARRISQEGNAAGVSGAEAIAAPLPQPRAEAAPAQAAAIAVASAPRRASASAGRPSVVDAPALQTHSDGDDDNDGKRSEVEGDR